MNRAQRGVYGEYTGQPEARRSYAGDEFKPGPAASTVISLSQILLAPLNAIFKAQVHAARSFVNG